MTFATIGMCIFMIMAWLFMLQTNHIENSFVPLVLAIRYAVEVGIRASRKE